MQLSSFTDLLCYGQSLGGNLGIRCWLDRPSRGELEGGVELFFSAELRVLGVGLGGGRYVGRWGKGNPGGHVSVTDALCLLIGDYGDFDLADALDDPGKCLWQPASATPVAPGGVGSGFLPTDNSEKLYSTPQPPHSSGEHWWACICSREHWWACI